MKYTDIYFIHILNKILYFSQTANEPTNILRDSKSLIEQHVNLNPVWGLILGCILWTSLSKDI